MRAHIVCARGEVTIDPPFHAATRITVRPRSGAEREYRIDSPDLAFAAQAREVRDQVRRGHTESPTMPLDDTLALMRVLEDARLALGACVFG